MIKRNQAVLVIPFLLAFFLLAISGPAPARDVPSDGMIRKRLLEEAPMRTMGVQTKTRPAPSEQEGGGLIDLPIPFPLDQYLISPAAVPFLEALGKALIHDDLRGYVFEIQGHTCDLGSDEHKLLLSERRAIAVREYLVRHFRVSPAQIRAVGYGDRRPVANNSTKEGKIKNRRVTVLNTFVSFSDREMPIVVKSRVTYRRGRNIAELQPGQTLTARDNYAVSFNANERCHVYVFQFGADSEVFHLFPNPAYHEGKNPVEAGRQYRIPGKPDQWLYLDENKGDEEIVIVASPGVLNEPDKVCLKVVKGTTLLARKPGTQAEKPLNTMGPKSIRIVEDNVDTADLFTWRFPFRHQ